jgi:hypothetical protein
MWGAAVCPACRQFYTAVSSGCFVCFERLTSPYSSNFCRCNFSFKSQSLVSGSSGRKKSSTLGYESVTLGSQTDICCREGRRYLSTLWFTQNLFHCRIIISGLLSAIPAVRSGISVLADGRSLISDILY